MLNFIKSRPFSIGLFLLGFAALFSFTFVPSKVEAACSSASTTIYVDSSSTDRSGCWGYDSSHAYQTIQAAINERATSFAGKTLTIYYRPSKTVTAEYVNTLSANDVIIQPWSSSSASVSMKFYVSGNRYLTIQDFKFDGGGIRMLSSSARPFTFKNNTFSSSSIEITGSKSGSGAMEGANITGNTFTNSYVSVYDYAGRTTLVSNSFSGVSFPSAWSESYYVKVSSSKGVDFVSNTTNGAAALKLSNVQGASVMSNVSNSSLTVPNYSMYHTAVGSFTNNVVQGGIYGVSFEGDPSSRYPFSYVSNNTFSNLSGRGPLIGIFIQNAVVQEMNENTVTATLGMTTEGVRISSSLVHQVQANHFVALDKGIHLLDSARVDEITENDFSGVYGIVIEGANGYIDSLVAGTVPSMTVLSNAQVDITRNVFSNIETGIALANARVGVIQNNALQVSSQGVIAYASRTEGLLGNEFFGLGASTGVLFEESSAKDFSKNTIDSFETGAALEASYVENYFENNLIVNNGLGLTVTAASYPFEIVYNTFYGQDGYALVVDGGPGLVVENNVFSEFGTPGAIELLGVDWLSDLSALNYNLYDGGSLGSGSFLLYADGLSYSLSDLKNLMWETEGYLASGSSLVSPSTGDYSLINKSLGVNSADTTYGVSRDIQNQVRPVCFVPDRGAYEIGVLFGPGSSDADADGLCGFQETAWGTNPSNSDTDGDALNDREEIYDYGTDPMDADTDGDSFSDGQEVTRYGTDPLNPADAPNDGDRDGMDDDWETSYGLDPSDASDATEDLDGDGLVNSDEYVEHTDPTNEDSDGDALNDGDEVFTYGTDALDADSDDDGFEDGLEVQYGSDPLDVDETPEDIDSDGDGLSDYDEDGIYGTDPSLADTDADGIEDGIEVTNGTDPLDSDSDNDGLSDGEEDSLGTDPLLSDSDGDGYLDGTEISYGTDPLDSADIPEVPDSDGDGMDDDWETTYGLDPADASDASEDLDGDSLVNLDEYEEGTDPTDEDSDGDSMTDAEELTNGTDPLNKDTDGDTYTDGQEDNFGSDPLDASVTPDTLDADGDGLSDWYEKKTSGTDKADPDSDDDGVDDGTEVTEGMDPLDTDSDDDGYSDGTEVDYGTDPLDSSDFPAVPDTDGDGIDDTDEVAGTYGYVTDPDNADTDGDGLDDYEEQAIYGTNPTTTDTDGDLFTDGYELDEGTDANDAAKMPTLTVNVVGYASIEGFGDKTVWNVASTSYGSALSIADMDYGDSYWVEIASEAQGALGLEYDKTAFLGTVSVATCTEDTALFNPTSKSCSSISLFEDSSDPDGEVTQVSDSGDLEAWSDLSAYYTFSDWTWFRAAVHSSTTYTAFRVRIGY